MGVGSWDPSGPEAESKPEISKVQLERFIELSQSDERLNVLDHELTDAEKALAPVMQWRMESWNKLLADYDDTDLWYLIRFFTVAEMRLPGWEAGERSPVIAINGLLKSRGVKLDSGKLQWIRNNSNNRFIPNGRLV